MLWAAHACHYRSNPHLLLDYLRKCERNGQARAG